MYEQSLDPGMERKLLGNLGEKLAVRFLRDEGYKIIERNYRSPQGEIDVVVQDVDLTELVFVEVRVRTSPFYGLPLESIDHRKKVKLRQVAGSYLTEWIKQRGGTTARFKGYRFDVIGILIEDYMDPKITHVKNAFYKGENL